MTHPLPGGGRTAAGDGAESRAARLAAWGALAALTTALAGGVLIDRAGTPDRAKFAVEEATRAYALRALDRHLAEAEADGDDETARWLEDLRRGIGGPTIHRFGGR